MKTLTKDQLFLAPRQQLVDSILEQQQHIESLQTSMQELQFQLDYLRRQVFGQKTERFVPDEDLQTALELGIDVTPFQNDKTEEIKYTRKKKKEKASGHGRGTMPTHLPIINKTIEPEEDTTGMTRIGEEKTWYYDYKPGSLRIIVITKAKYAKSDNSGIVIAPTPPLPIEKGNAGPGLMAQVVVDKYVYHTPLDRQRKKFRNQYQVNFSESWLCDIVKNVAFWIEPLYTSYKNHLLEAKYLCADETPIPVLVKEKKGETHRGYFWVYYDPLGKITIFDYRKSRSREGPCDFLANFSGILQVDGYDGYNEVISRNGIMRAACMDHVRRKFEQALSNDHERAKHALDTLRMWYKLESECKENGLTHEQRFERRMVETAPSMNAFRQWLVDQVTEVLPKSAIGIAIQYALGQWGYFKPFLSDPRVELSNIATENKIRPVAIGRKNFMFIGSHQAAQRAAMIYSIVAIAQIHGVNPYVYFKEILTHFPAANNAIVDQFLLPAWKPPKENIKEEE